MADPHPIFGPDQTRHGLLKHPIFGQDWTRQGLHRASYIWTGQVGQDRTRPGKYHQEVKLCSWMKDIICGMQLLTDQKRRDVLPLFFTIQIESQAQDSKRWVRVLATQLRCASLVRATTPGCCCCLRIDTQFSAVGAAKNSHPSFCPPSSDFGCSPNILFGAGVGIS